MKERPVARSDSILVPPSWQIVDNELVDLYRTTYDATINVAASTLRCFACGESMIPGATRVTDGIDVWHPGCSALQTGH